MINFHDVKPGVEDTLNVSGSIIPSRTDFSEIWRIKKLSESAPFFNFKSFIFRNWKTWKLCSYSLTMHPLAFTFCTLVIIFRVCLFRFLLFNRLFNNKNLFGFDFLGNERERERRLSNENVCLGSNNFRFSNNDLRLGYGYLRFGNDFRLDFRYYSGRFNFRFYSLIFLFV